MGSCGIYRVCNYFIFNMKKQAIFIAKLLGIKGWDKVLHFEAGFIINVIAFCLSFNLIHFDSVFGAYFVSLIISNIASGFAGLAKELYDQHTDGLFSVEDLYATVYGGLAASLILILI